MIQDELELYETLLTKVESDDRVSRKRLERLKEGLKERLESLATRKDDLLTISEIGIDQIIVYLTAVVILLVRPRGGVTAEERVALAPASTPQQC